jgi:tripartite-type tricarboxylate transporter receptor subunit TctC
MNASNDAIRRRTLLAGCACVLATPHLMAQQAYPTKPIRMVLPNSPGSSVDAWARQLATPLAASLGQAVVPDNVAGQGGVIGVNQIVRAPKDGHTIGIVSNNFNISAYLYRLPYDPVKDIVPLTIMTSSPLVLTVNPKLPVRNVQELFTLAKSRTGNASLTYGSAGVGSVPHLAGALMTMLSGLDLLHVPYKGMNTYTTDLVGGQVDIGFMPTSVAVPMVRNGSLRPLAVTTTRRAAAFPDLPTLADASVPGYELSGSLAAIVAAGTPPAILRKLNAELVHALQSPEAVKFAESQGSQIVASSTEDAARWFAREYETYGKLAKKIGLKPEN